MHDVHALYRFTLSSAFFVTRNKKNVLLKRATGTTRKKETASVRINR